MKLTTHIEKIQSQERGYIEETNVQSWHSFSFGSYLNPRRLNFGALFACNQYLVEPEGKLSPTSCKNTEILLFVLLGDLAYQINEENKEILHQGECLRLSAGAGLRYQMTNGAEDTPVSFLELWIHPQERDLPPSWEKKQNGLFNPLQQDKSGVSLLASKFATPLSSSEGVFLPQDVSVYIGRLFAGEAHHAPQSFYRGGFFILVLTGELLVQKQKLFEGEALLLKESAALELHSLNAATFLLVQLSLSTL